MGSPQSRASSRVEQVAVVESYFDCCVRNDFEALPIAPDYTIETPLTPKLSGHAAVDYLKAASAHIRGIRIRQHIVEGDHVATWFEEETTWGPLKVVAKLEIEGGCVKGEVAFYDPRRIAGGAEDRP
jgi:hypothetical protein